MVEAVIVSTARTGIGKAYRGALNNTEGPTMAGHVIGEAREAGGYRAGGSRRRGDGLRHATGHHGDERRAQGCDPRRPAR